MQFANSHLKIFKDDIQKVIEKFNLSSDVKVIAFAPGANAIFIEEKDNKHFKLHINLEENRIIAIKQMEGEKIDSGSIQKYAPFMK